MNHHASSLGNSTCSKDLSKIQTQLEHKRESKRQCIQHICMRSIREVKKIVIMIPKIY